jgi:hypothetical protein
LAWARFSGAVTVKPLGRLQQIGQPDPVQHLRAQAVERGEADIRAILGRIIVEAERTRAEQHVDDLDDPVGNALHIGILRHDLAKPSAQKLSAVPSWVEWERIAPKRARSGLRLKVHEFDVEHQGRLAGNHHLALLVTLIFAAISQP